MLRKRLARKLNQFSPEAANTSHHGLSAVEEKLSAVAAILDGEGARSALPTTLCGACRRQVFKSKVPLAKTGAVKASGTRFAGSKVASRTTTPARWRVIITIAMLKTLR